MAILAGSSFSATVFVPQTSLPMTPQKEEIDWQFWYSYLVKAEEAWRELNEQKAKRSNLIAELSDLLGKSVCSESTLSKIKPSKAETGQGVSLSKLKELTKGLDRLLAESYNHSYDQHSGRYEATELATPFLENIEPPSKMKRGQRQNLLVQLQGTYKCYALSSNGRYLHWSVISMQASGELSKRTSINAFDYKGNSRLFSQQGYWVMDICDEQRQYLSHSVFRLGNTFANPQVVPELHYVEGVTTTFSVDGQPLALRCLLVKHSKLPEDYRHVQAGAVELGTEAWQALQREQPLVRRLLGLPGNVVLAPGGINHFGPPALGDNQYAAALIDAARAAADRLNWRQATEYLRQASAHGFDRWHTLDESPAFEELLRHLRSGKLDEQPSGGLQAYFGI